MQCADEEVGIGRINVSVVVETTPTATPTRKTSLRKKRTNRKRKKRRRRKKPNHLQRSNNRSNHLSMTVDGFIHMFPLKQTNGKLKGKPSKPGDVSDQKKNSQYDVSFVIAEGSHV